MSAIDKEKIFVELRKYHEDGFSDELSTGKMNDLRKEFIRIEDDIISMLLSLVNGKVGFVEFSDVLTTFARKVKVTKSTDRAEDTDRNFFAAKISHLAHILDMGREAVFKLKLPRGVKAAN